MNTVSLTCMNGLGDKMLDVIGFYVLCKYLDYKPVIYLNSYHHLVTYVWGGNKYDERLFHFNDLIMNAENSDYYISSFNPSVTLSPYKVYKYINTINPQITFEQVSNSYSTYAREIIKPSVIILSKIPEGIETAYGIHLRKSDKVKDNGDADHENSSYEFEIIIQKLFENIHRIMEEEENPTFLIVSEDEIWKNEIKVRIKYIFEQINKNVNLIYIDYSGGDEYDNYRSILDMFCLSKCKTIIQGVKYSTFSILAALVGNNKLINYSDCLSNHSNCNINAWTSAVEVNNVRNYDLSMHKAITDKFLNFHFVKS